MERTIMNQPIFPVVLAAALSTAGVVVAAQPVVGAAGPAAHTASAPAAAGSAAAAAGSVAATSGAASATVAAAARPAAAQARSGGYVGPSSAALVTVKQLLADGKDDQYARLQGKIVSHDRDKKYTFADGTGSMQVEISPRRFPPDQPIGAEQRVEISGKFDKGWRKSEFDVKEIRVLP